jgi:hypothetical protein
MESIAWAGYSSAFGGSATQTAQTVTNSPRLRHNLIRTGRYAFASTERDIMSDHIKFEVLIYCVALLGVIAGLSANVDLGALLHTALGIR